MGIGQSEPWKGTCDAHYIGTLRYTSRQTRCVDGSSQQPRSEI
jgi:hypothetical protein